MPGRLREIFQVVQNMNSLRVRKSLLGQLLINVHRRGLLALLIEIAHDIQRVSVQLIDVREILRNVIQGIFGRSGFHVDRGEGLERPELFQFHIGCGHQGRITFHFEFQFVLLDLEREGEFIPLFVLLFAFPFPLQTVQFRVVSRQAVDGGKSNEAEDNRGDPFHNLVQENVLSS